MTKAYKSAFIFILLFLILTPSLLYADDPDKDPFYTEGAMLPLSSITEYVDPFSGNLTVVQRDIYLPGNGGLDLNIVRTYSSAIWGRRDTSFPGLVARNERSPLGIGWSLHMGIVKNPFGAGGGNPVVVMPDGSNHVVYIDGNNATRSITKDYWRYETVESNIWQLTLTDGTRYTFEFNTNAGYHTLDGVMVAQVTKIEHPNRVSKITITYDKSQNSYSYIDRIQDSAGRYIDFYYDYTNHRLTKISGAGITYNYYYTTINSTKYLSEVAPPVGNRWKYAYHTSSLDLDKITYPHGGTIEYDYSDLWFDTGAVNVQFRVVTQRKTGGRIQNAGTWTYDYNSGGSSGDVTIVDGPDSYEEIYTHNGWRRYYNKPPGPGIGDY